MFLAAIGWAGAAFLLAAYALVSAERIRAGGVAFQLLNLFGAAALTANSAYHRAWPSAVLNLIWIVIGTAAITTHARAHAHAQLR
ncbi:MULTISPECIES: hypothetical protein [unclassified Streptomyces]|uniref:CBU_0592 family membrane protein n=1 Tax=unclassified Streptomyces TaxID=2593676 RepID=UPI001EF35CB4|nr:MULTISPECIES: hypothetical protein [unclassified Streptomyces]